MTRDKRSVKASKKSKRAPGRVLRNEMRGSENGGTSNQRRAPERPESTVKGPRKDEREGRVL